MLRHDLICTVTYAGISHSPVRIIADHTGRTALWKPNEPKPLWAGMTTITADAPAGQPKTMGPWTITTSVGQHLTASRFDGCRCQFGDLLARGERDLAPLDIPA